MRYLEYRISNGFHSAKNVKVKYHGSQLFDLCLESGVNFRSLTRQVIYIVQKTFTFKRLKSSVELHEEMLKKLELLATRLRLRTKNGNRMYSAFPGLAGAEEFANSLC